MPLSNIWVPRRDSRGLFVPKRPHTALPGGNMSTTAQWANWIYPVPTRGIYASNVDQINIVGVYGGSANRTPTPYGLGINTPLNWEWGGSSVNTPGGFAVTRQVMFSVFYLYDATKLITAGLYPSLGPSRSINFDPIGPSSAEFGLHWSNQSGEQRISASAGTDFGGTAATVTGVGNGLHVVVASILANGNTELYLDGDLVSTTAAGTYGRSSTVSPNFYWAGLGPANQNVGVILLSGIIYGQTFTAAEVKAFTANPFGYFFIDPPSVSRTSFYYSIPAPPPVTSAWLRPARTRTEQPRQATLIDWSNQITRNLEVALSPKLISITNSGVEESPVQTGNGGAIAYRNPSAGGSNSFVLPKSITSQDWTIFQEISNTPLNGLYSSTGGVYNSSNSSQRIHIHFQAYASNAFGADARPYYADWNTTQSLPYPNGRSYLAITINSVTSQIAGYINGVLATGGTSLLSSTSAITVDRAELFRKVGGPDPMSAGSTSALFYVWSRALSAQEIFLLTQNPWQLFQPQRRQMFAALVVEGIYPNSDITTTGWSAIPPGSIYAAIDETTPSDTDYIISPNLAASPGPAVFGLNQSAPAGSYTVNVRAKYGLTAGQFRVSMLDSGGTSVGTSAWTAVTGAFTTYPISLTTTGTAVRVRIEVQ